MLVTLQILNIFWTFLIVRVLWRKLTTDQVSCKLTWLFLMLVRGAVGTVSPQCCLVLVKLRVTLTICQLYGSRDAQSLNLYSVYANYIGPPLLTDEKSTRTCAVVLVTGPNDWWQFSKNICSKLCVLTGKIFFGPLQYCIESAFLCCLTNIDAIYYCL